MNAETMTMVLFCSGLALFTALMGFLVGYYDGKQKGRVEEIDDRISRTIIEEVRRNGQISGFYSKQDIRRAIEYGKKHDFFFSVEEVRPLRVIKGGKK